jgi:hypothetical protein
MKRSLDDVVFRIALAGLLSVLLCGPFYRYFIKEPIDAMWMSGYTAWQISGSTAGPLVIQALLFTLCSFAAVLGISFFVANEVVKLSNWLQDRSSRGTSAKAGANPP